MTVAVTTVGTIWKVANLLVAVQNQANPERANSCLTQRSQEGSFGIMRTKVFRSNNIKLGLF
jgi:hypothetical protein